MHLKPRAIEHMCRTPDAGRSSNPHTVTAMSIDLDECSKNTYEDTSSRLNPSFLQRQASIKVRERLAAMFKSFISSQAMDFFQSPKELRHCVMSSRDLGIDSCLRKDC